MEEQLLQKQTTLMDRFFVFVFCQATQLLNKVTTDNQVKMYAFLNILALFYGSIW